MRSELNKTTLTLFAVSALLARASAQTTPVPPTDPAAPVTADTVPPLAAMPNTGPAVAIPGDNAPVLTLDEAVAIALRQNGTVAASTESVTRAQSQARAAGAAGLPQVRVTGSAVRQRAVSVPFPEGDQVVSFVVTPSEAKTATAQVSQLIDIFGQVRKARSIANVATKIQQLNVARSRSEIIYQTKATYYNVLRAQGAVDVSQAAVADAEEQLRLATAAEQQGTGTQFDITRARVTVSDRQQTLISAQNTLRLEGAALNNVLGRSIKTPVVVARLDSTPDRNVDIDAQTDKAMQSRPELVQTELSIEANKLNVGLQRLGNRPSFSVTAGETYLDPLTPFNKYHEIWSVGVDLNFPIIDGGLTRDRVRTAESDVRSVQIQRDQLKLQVAYEVTQAGQSVQETADRYTVADQAVTQAEEALRLARVRFENGIGTTLEVVDAETQLAQARFNRNNVLYDHLTSRAEFDRSLMGRLSPAPMPQPATANAVAAGGVSGSFNAGSSPNAPAPGER